MSERFIQEIGILIENFNLKIRESKIGCVTNDIRDNIYQELMDIKNKIEELLKIKQVHLESIEKKKQLSEKNFNSISMFKKDRLDRKNKKYENFKKFNIIMKTQINEIELKDFKKISKDNEVDELFKFLYCKLYKEKPESYNFDQFLNHITIKSKVFQSKLANFKIIELNNDDFMRIEKWNKYKYSKFEKNTSFINLLIWLEYCQNCYEAFIEHKASYEEFDSVLEKEAKYINEKHYYNEIYNENKNTISFLEKLNTILINYSEEVQKLDNDMQIKKVNEFNFNKFSKAIEWRKLFEYNK